jgi:hypothetical protein
LKSWIHERPSFTISNHTSQGALQEGENIQFIFRQKIPVYNGGI